MYYMTFIDERSCFVRIFPIRKKSNVYAKFKLFYPWFERRFSCFIQMLHSDQCGEYIALKPYLDEKLIEQSFSPRYAPDQNSIAERSNRTFIEGAHAILSHKGLP